MVPDRAQHVPCRFDVFQTGTLSDTGVVEKTFQNLLDAGSCRYAGHTIVRVRCLGSVHHSRAYAARIAVSKSHDIDLSKGSCAPQLHGIYNDAVAVGTDVCLLDGARSPPMCGVHVQRAFSPSDASEDEREEWSAATLRRC